MISFKLDFFYKDDNAIVWIDSFSLEKGDEEVTHLLNSNNESSDCNFAEMVLFDSANQRVICKLVCFKKIKLKGKGYHWIVSER